HGEMQRIRMNKAGRYQAPVFSAERIRSEVTAPTQQSLITEAHERCQRSTAENHPQEHRSIDAYEKRGGGKMEHHARIQPAAGAAAGASGAAVAQNGCHAFFVDRKLSAALQAVGHDA